MKTAFITGVSGQDGAYLAQLLLEKKYKVIGTDRRSARSNTWRLRRLGIENKVIFEEMEMGEIYEIERLFKKGIVGSPLKTLIACPTKRGCMAPAIATGTKIIKII